MPDVQALTNYSMFLSFILIALLPLPARLIHLSRYGHWPQLPVHYIQVYRRLK